MRSVITCAAALACALSAAPPAAAAEEFTSFSTGAQEVPPVVSSATADADYLLSDDGDTFRYSILIEGLDLRAPATAFGDFTDPYVDADPGDNVFLIHFHNNVAGVNGPVVFDILTGSNTSADADILFEILSDTSARITGDIDRGTDAFSAAISPILGVALDFDSFLDQVRGGGIYLNIHTTRVRSGEIRGQLLAVPEPAVLSLFGLGLAGLALRQRRRG